MGPLLNQQTSFHSNLLFRMGRLIEMELLKSLAAASQTAIQEELRIVWRCKRWVGWDEWVVLSLVWVMGAAAPMAPPKRENNNTIHQFQFNKGKKGNELCFADSNQRKELELMRRRKKKQSEWSTKQPRCAARQREAQQFILSFKLNCGWSCAVYFFNSSSSLLLFMKWKHSINQPMKKLVDCWELLHFSSLFFASGGSYELPLLSREEIPFHCFHQFHFILLGQFSCWWREEEWVN